MGLRILLVEDSALIPVLLQSMLEQAGHALVAHAKTADEALEAYKAHRPDIVFLDIVFPGNEDNRALKELRAFDPAAKVVIVTGVDPERIPEALQGIPVDAVLRKPFTSEEVRDALRRASA